jgi:large subunit ribosomal protein L13
VATVVDASGLVMGRMSTHVAKRLLKGEDIVIVNAENAIITGGRDAIIREFNARRARGSERKGPFYPRMSDRILRRAVRGMLPYQKPRGKIAFQKLQVYIGVPKGFASSKTITFADAKKPYLTEYLKLGELSRILGAKV